MYIQHSVLLTKNIFTNPIFTIIKNDISVFFSRISCINGSFSAVGDTIYFSVYSMKNIDLFYTTTTDKIMIH